MNVELKPVPDGRFSPEDWEYILLQMVNDRSGVDFSMYRMPTFRRRYLKRMSISDAMDLRGYVKLLEDNPEELDLLVTDLLIGVTSFFRDRAAFRVLDESAIIPLFSREDNSNIRCWAAGCSTGMEAYSIAILMEKAKEKYGGSYTVFATDLSRSALAKASKGVYTRKQFDTVPAEYRKYFAETEKGWKINGEIRGHMVFSYHDVLADPPFAHMDIVSCRNMMIYLKPVAQELVTGRLNYSLSMGGYLFLGSGETPGTKQGNLETVDAGWRLFRKVSETVVSFNMFPMEKSQASALLAHETRGYHLEEDEVSARSRNFTSCLEERFFPDCVFIDEDYRILFINGDMNSYLSIPPGIPGGSLLPMLPGPLKSAVRSGVRRARGSFRKVQCDTSGDVTIFVSCISPVEMSGVFLLEFVRNHTDSSAETAKVECSRSDTTILEEQIAILESDLATARRELRSRTGELQASNEELQTTNEEIRSANEELIASNEELIASNEELQRLNRQLTVLTDDMRNLLESMDIGSLFLDRDLHIRRFNPMACRFFKIKESDTGRAVTDLTTSIEANCLRKLMEATGKVLADGEAVELSLEADITGNWLAKISPYRTSTGTVEGSVITFVDVTALRDREKSLADSERKFRGLFNGFPMGAMLVFCDDEADEFAIIDVNPAFVKIKEKTPEIVSHPLFRNAILSRGGVFEFTIGDRDYYCRVFRPVDFAGTLCVTLSDATDSKRAEELRKALEKRLHEAQMLAGMGIWKYNGLTRAVKLSAEAAQLFGMSPGLPISLDSFRQLIENFDQFYLQVREALEKGRTFTGTVSAGAPAFTKTKFFKVSCYSTGTDGERIVYGYALDITREVENESILKTALDKLAETQRMARVGVIEIQWNEDFSLHREDFHDSAIQVLKLQQGAQNGFFQKHMEEELSVSLLSKLRNCGKTGEEFSMDTPMKNGAGERVFIQLTARRKVSGDEPRVINIVIMDVTRRHQLENELKHAERLRSVGELAGGIAHDFNNQLMGIIGFAECMRNGNNSLEELEYIRGILKSAERAGSLVRQLLAYSRKGLSHIAPFDIHRLAEEVIALLKRSIDRRIEIRKDFRAENATVLGDASEMNNAILNLALNARDAMDDGGTMTFATLQEEPGTVTFVLSDTGRGMTPEVLEKAFEPFFTTKSLGDGTGMGLAAVYGTVTAHNGTIAINSEPGGGTSAVIVLPVSETLSEDQADSTVTDGSPMEGTVLIVDDEEVVREVLTKLVSSLGFDVVTASDGVQALEMYRENAGDIRLVLMDMTMPRMNGIDTYLQMKEIRPEVKVVILSGHSAETASAEMIRHGVIKVLQKPVRLSLLSDTIRKAVSS